MSLSEEEMQRRISATGEELISKLGISLETTPKIVRLATGELLQDILIAQMKYMVLLGPDKLILILRTLADTLEESYKGMDKEKKEMMDKTNEIIKWSQELEARSNPEMN